jgi:hypothetical protein
LGELVVDITLSVDSQAQQRMDFLPNEEMFNHAGYHKKNSFDWPNIVGPALSTYLRYRDCHKEIISTLIHIEKRNREYMETRQNALVLRGQYHDVRDSFRTATQQWLPNEMIDFGLPLLFRIMVYGPIRLENAWNPVFELDDRECPHQLWNYCLYVSGILPTFNAGLTVSTAILRKVLDGLGFWSLELPAWASNFLPDISSKEDNLVIVSIFQAFWLIFVYCMVLNHLVLPALVSTRIRLAWRFTRNQISVHSKVGRFSARDIHQSVVRFLVATLHSLILITETCCPLAAFLRHESECQALSLTQASPTPSVMAWIKEILGNLFWTLKNPLRLFNWLLNYHGTSRVVYIRVCLLTVFYLSAFVGPGVPKLADETTILTMPTLTTGDPAGGPPVLLYTLYQEFCQRFGVSSLVGALFWFYLLMWIPFFAFSSLSIEMSDLGFSQTYQQLLDTNSETCRQWLASARSLPHTGGIPSLALVESQSTELVEVEDATGLCEFFRQPQTFEEFFNEKASDRFLWNMVLVLALQNSRLTAQEKAYFRKRFGESLLVNNRFVENVQTEGERLLISRYLRKLWDPQNVGPFLRQIFCETYKIVPSIMLGGAITFYSYYRD